MGHLRETVLPFDRILSLTSLLLFIYFFKQTLDKRCYATKTTYKSDYNLWLPITTWLLLWARFATPYRQCTQPREKKGGNVKAKQKQWLSHVTDVINVRCLGSKKICRLTHRHTLPAGFCCVLHRYEACSLMFFYPSNTCLTLDSLFHLNWKLLWINASANFPKCKEWI